jgi:hypothetical protein
MNFKTQNEYTKVMIHLLFFQNEFQNKIKAKIVFHHKTQTFKSWSQSRALFFQSPKTSNRKIQTHTHTSKADKHE